MVTELLTVSAFTLGLALLGEEGMLLRGLKKWLEKQFTKHKMHTFWNEDLSSSYSCMQTKVHWSFKPIWGCPPCMAGYWGVIIWGVQLWRDAWQWDVMTWVVSLLGAAFLNALLWNTYSK